MSGVHDDPNILDLFTSFEETPDAAMMLSPTQPAPTAGPAQKRFEEFHRQNPHVLTVIIQVALQLQAAGLKQGGMWLVFGRLRWIYAIQTQGGSGFRLNNNYASYYARLAMLMEPRLKGFFQVRKQGEPWAIDWEALELEPPSEDD
jgi:hypothetical protein